MSRAIDCTTGDLQMYSLKHKFDFLIKYAIELLSIIPLVTYSIDPCRHAMLKRLSTKILDSNMAHLCILSLAMLVECTDLTVMEIS